MQDLDDSSKDIDIIEKQYALNFKQALNENKKNVKEFLKDKLISGFYEYYEILNNKSNNQSKSYKEIEDNLAKSVELSNNIYNQSHKNLEKLKTIRNNLINKNYKEKLKAKLFTFIKDRYLDKKYDTYKENLVIYLYVSNLKRKLFEKIKKATIFKPIKEFEKEISTSYILSIEKTISVHNEEKQKLLNLIKKAEQKLIHENKKKLQTKMLFDKIVLKNVSELNIKTLSLSNEALKGN